MVSEEEEKETAGKRKGRRKKNVVRISLTIKGKKGKERTKKDIELEQNILNSLRAKAIHDMVSDDSPDQKKFIEAGYRILNICGSKGNTLQKSWRWLRRGGDFNI